MAQTVALFGACTLLIVLSGVRLSRYGDVIAEQSGLGGTWMGVLVMAAGNLFGSNLFNIAVLGVDDVLYAKGSLLAAVSPAHLATLGAAITMTGIVIIGLTYRARRKRFRLSWDAIGVVAVYAAGVLLLRVLTS